MIEKYNSNLFVFDPNVKAMGDSQLGYIGSMLFTDTLDSMMDQIVQRNAMRVSSFRMTFHQSHFIDQSQLLPLEMQIVLLKEL